MFPFLALSISFHVGDGPIFIDVFVGFGEPIQSSTATGLPFHAKGVWGLEMFGNNLFHGSDGICLECLFFITGHGFVGLGFGEVGSVEEGVEGCVSGDGEVVVPCFGEGGGVSGMGVVDGTDGLGA